MPQVRERDPYFDNLKGILIVLVCAGHLLNLYRDSNPYCNYFFHIIYAFHMPLFFYISGYFSKNIDKTYKKAFETLIIPAIPFELLYYIMHVVTKADNTEPFLTPVFAYWFCFALFFCRLLLPFLSRVRGIVFIAFLVAFAAGFNPHIDEYMSLSRFLCMLPFFLMGYFTTDKSMKRIRELNKGLSVAVGVASAIILIVILQHSGGDMGFTLRSPYEDIQGLYFRMFQFVLSVPLSIMVMKLVPKEKSYLSIIGQRTLQIYFLHFYFRTAIQLFNPLKDYNVVNCIALMIAAPIIAAILSCESVSKAYNALVKATGRLLIKK